MAFIKKVKTDKNFYIYDINTNDILKVDELTFNILSEKPKKLFEDNLMNYNHNEIENAKKQVLLAKKKYCYFSLNYPKIKTFSNSAIEEYLSRLKNELGQLVLNITEACNMRCEYCAYSGSYYYNRKHTSKVMNFSIAKKVVDFYFNTNRKGKKVIGFYGGEPLLNFELIKKIINYIDNYYKEKNIQYTITTNGTLLNKEIFEFLIKKEISLVISLDGPIKIHDRYRKLVNSSGTFNQIMKNLELLNKTDENYFNKCVGFNVVLSPPYEVHEVYNFFASNEMLNKILERIRFSYVSSKDTSFFDKFETYDINKKFKKDINDLLKKYFSLILNNRTSEDMLLNRLFSSDFLTIYNRDIGILTNTYPSHGQCLPGVRKLFVSTNGNFYMCEQVGEVLKIGDAETGFYLDIISNFLEQYSSFFENKCYGCWAIRLCRKCFNTIRKDFTLNEDRLNNFCTKTKKNLYNNLIYYLNIREKKNTAFDFLKDIKVE